MSSTLTQVSGNCMYEFELLRLYTLLLRHVIWGKLLHSNLREVQYPYTVYNECVWHKGTRLTRARGDYERAFPESYR